MAAGTTIYRQADTGNLGKYIGDKILSARKMAAEQRKENEDSEVQTGRGYYFGKALASEFGGDRIARTKGMFKTDPDITEDPALSKKERFEGGIQGELQRVQDFLDDGGTQEKPLKSWLTPLLDAIANNNKKIADGFRKMGNKTEEASGEQQKQNKNKEETLGFFDFLTGYFEREEQRDEEELKLQREKLERIRKGIDDASMANIEGMQEAPGVSSADISGGEGAEGSVGGKNKGGKSGGLLGDIVGGLTEGLAEGATEKFLDRVGKSKKFGKILRRLPLGKRRMRNQYGGKEIGPLPMGSSSPWAKAGPGEMGNSMGFVPRLAEGTAPMTKLASGVAPTLQPGRYTKPTVGSLGADDAVVPLNRNNPISDLMDQAESFKQKSKSGSSEINAEKEAKLLQDVTLSIPQVSAGMALGSLGSIIPGISVIPGVSNYLIDFARDKANEFGLPENLIGNVTKTEVIKQKKKSGGTVSSAGSSIKTINDKTTDKKEDRTPGWLKSIKNLFGLRPDNNNNNNNRNTPGSVSRGQSISMASGKTSPTSYIYSAYRSADRPKHRGIDISGGPWKENAPLVVEKPGVVEDIGMQPDGWGNFVVIKHDDGMYTLYGHLNEVNVKENQRVGPDANGNMPVIGKIGSTGKSSHPHLHFEIGKGWDGVIKGGMDPTPFINDYVDVGDQSNPSISQSPGSQGDAPEIRIAAAQTSMDKIVSGMSLEDQKVVASSTEEPLPTIVPTVSSGYNNNGRNKRRTQQLQQLAAASPGRLADYKLGDGKTTENFPVGARA